MLRDSSQVKYAQRSKPKKLVVQDDDKEKDMDMGDQDEDDDDMHEELTNPTYKP